MELSTVNKATIKDTSATYFVGCENDENGNPLVRVTDGYLGTIDEAIEILSRCKQEIEIQRGIHKSQKYQQIQ